MTKAFLLFHWRTKYNESNMADEDDNSSKRDFFRDTWARYLGYVNEVGEAFKSRIPRFCYFGSYLISSSYAFGDASSKSFQMYQTKGNLPTDVRLRSCTEAFLEAIIWQGLASVAIPGFTINRICKLMGFVLRRYASRIPVATQSWITTGVGLGAIPVIIHPIDRSVDYLMAEAIRISGELGIEHNIDHSHGWSFPGPDTEVICENEENLQFDLF